MMDETKTENAVSFGRKLQTTRESLRLSEKEAAARLHLSPNIIVSIEKEDFSNGLPPTFLRGYIRSYARSLNFSDPDIDAGLEALGIAKPQPSITSYTPSKMTPMENFESDRYFQWISYVVVFVLLALTVVWWNSHPKSNALTTNLTNAVTKPKVAPKPQPQPTNAATSEENSNLKLPPAGYPAPKIDAATTNNTNIALPPIHPSIIQTQNQVANGPKVIHKHKRIRKRRYYRHNVSGMMMDVPEPGFESNNYYY